MPYQPTGNTAHHIDRPNLAIEEPDIVASAFKTEPSRWRTSKTVVKHTATVAGVGIQVGQAAAHMPTMIALFTVGAAASATGIGLVAGGAAITLGTMAASARSAYKTHQHLNVLGKLQQNAGGMACSLIDEDGRAWYHNAVQHAQVVETLDYVINKKSNKRGKKVVGAVGGGMLNAVYGLGKAIYKTVKQTKGKNRMLHANVLATHLVTHNCALAQGIVAELYSVDEMLWMLEQDSTTVARLLAEKMKST